MHSYFLQCYLFHIINAPKVRKLYGKYKCILEKCATLPQQSVEMGIYRTKIESNTPW